MDRTTPLRLSAHVLPQVRVGTQLLTPQNLGRGADRLAFVDGLVRQLELLSRMGRPTSEILRFRDHLPFGERLVSLAEVDGKLVPRAREGIEDTLHFDPERLRILMLDGRKRRLEDLVSIEAGEDAPLLSSLISRMAAGTSANELLATDEAKAAEMDEGFVAALLDQGILERGGSSAPGRLHDGDHVTWLGHAAAMVQSDRTSVWIDPHLYPVLRWTDAEAKKVFSPDYADSVLFESYGPECRQLALRDLPSPDAVLITHQDVDHFNLGVLMALPVTTTFVVPASSPDHPWDVDLAHLIHTVLGSGRRVVRLAHGETVRFGNVAVTAFPFTGEFPTELPHAWNCYLVETDRSTTVFTADSEVGEPQIEFLRARLSRARPSLLMARPSDEQPTHGWREHPSELYNPVRLWPWYAPLAGWFAETAPIGVGHAALRSLAEHGLRFVFPYAAGATPWFRLHEPGHLFMAGVGAFSRAELLAFAAASAGAGLTMPPLRHGVPFRLA